MQDDKMNSIMKSEFNWEIPYESIPLPSEGIVYDPNLTLYNRDTLKIKAMTAREEDILTSQAYVKEGSVIEKLIESCLVDKSFSVNDLIIGDRNALLVSIRITGYGSDYKMNHTCQHCDSKNIVMAQLSELGIKRLKSQPVEPGKNLFKYELPVTKKNVHYKFTTGHDEAEEEITNKRREKLGVKAPGKVTSFLERSIVSIDGVTDKNKITHFIKNMPALDSRRLRIHMKENEPGIDMTWEYECKNCRGENKIDLPLTSEFFWPTT
jgi:hypothetical protein